MSDKTVPFTAIPGGATPDKVAESIRGLERQLPQLIAMQRTLAQLTRARYLALIDEGFSEAQALELSKKIG